MKISILGSTGSIGQSTLKVIEHANKLEPGSFEVEVLIAGSNSQYLAKQALEFNANIAVVANPEAYADLKDHLAGTSIECAAGFDSVIEAAQRPVERCMAAIAGSEGLLPTMAAINAGNTILLANKESMVCAGELMKKAARNKNVEIIPTDSEHNAIFQVLQNKSDVEKMILTASGGPFRTWSLDDLKRANPKQALKHPNWSMGAKITLDSATLMNKGLELIEACYLFDVPEDMIDVVVHPQSIIHSMVAYKDGSVLAQMGMPDMQTPIAYALGCPQRVPTNVDRLDLVALSKLDFEAPDHERFPALNLARKASRAGMLGTCVYNAANEISGERYLRGQCGFMDISLQVGMALEKALDMTDPEMPTSVSSIDDVLQITRRVRYWISHNMC